MKTVADQCREMGLKVGDTIEGTQIYLRGFQTARLTLLWVGEEIVVWRETKIDQHSEKWSDPTESASWVLDCRDWRKINDRDPTA